MEIANYLLSTITVIKVVELQYIRSFVYIHVHNFCFGRKLHKFATIFNANKEFARRPDSVVERKERSH